MTTQQTYMIIGAGRAGATAAQTLRAEGFGGRVLLVGAEADPPYKRPPLSKGYLIGSENREKIYIHGLGWYEDNDVELLLGTQATALDPTTHTVTLGQGQAVGYDKLLLATGASARRLQLAGADLDGIHYLRAVADSDRLREALAEGGHEVVVVGGGWIGLETAAAAREYGNHVTVIEQGPTPLSAVLGPELGEVFARLHRKHDVTLRVETGVTGFRGTGGRLTGVVTDRDEVLPADIAIVGVGAIPNTTLAETAGLGIGNGVTTDALLRTTHPDVFAAGDVANRFSPLLGHSLRVEHDDNAKQGGPAAARAMLGQAIAYDAMPFFFTDQYDLGMEYTGYALPGDYDRIVYRGDPESFEFIAFWLAGDRVLAGMNVNIWDVADHIGRLIRERAPIDKQRLRDPDIPLAELVPATGGGIR